MTPHALPWFSQAISGRHCPQRWLGAWLALAALLVWTTAAAADTVKVLTAGAFKQVLAAVIPQFAGGGHSVTWEADTVGGLVRRIEDGAVFDVVIASPAAIKRLAAAGKVVGGGVDLARVGVGIAIREGAAKPDISTTESFKRALLATRAVAYIDPAAGGSSGIYFAGLIDRLGIGSAIRAKSVLVNGGFAAERIVSGEADMAVQQISELLPVKGVAMVGPLPDEIQNYTTYTAAVAAGSEHGAAARALIDVMRSAPAEAIIIAKGMQPAIAGAAQR